MCGESWLAVNDSLTRHPSFVPSNNFLSLTIIEQFVTSVHVHGLCVYCLPILQYMYMYMYFLACTCVNQVVCQTIKLLLSHTSYC